VIYKGPFLQVTDDSGAIYRRGDRVTVDAARLRQLQTGPLAEMFTIIQPGVGKACSA
jgi:hypothetical protein